MPKKKIASWRGQQVQYTDDILVRFRARNAQEFLERLDHVRNPLESDEVFAKLPSAIKNSQFAEFYRLQRSVFALYGLLKNPSGVWLLVDGMPQPFKKGDEARADAHIVTDGLIWKALGEKKGSALHLACELMELIRQWREWDYTKPPMSWSVVDIAVRAGRLGEQIRRQKPMDSDTLGNLDDLARAQLDATANLKQARKKPKGKTAEYHKMAEHLHAAHPSWGLTRIAQHVATKFEKNATSMHRTLARTLDALGITAGMKKDRSSG